MAATLTLAGCASTPESPGAKALEEGLSLSPASNQVYECLEEKGWDVTLTWDGGIEVSSATIPTAQRDLFDEDAEACWQPINDRIQNMGADEISDVYQDELTTRECLIDLGFEVGEPPSKQEFIDTFQGLRWSAYADSNVDASVDDEWRETNIACPQPAWSFGV
ncbi:hypothetical protein [Agromyces sp. GXQ0307]|uniref:hypothetical protein n=1 Tax=Agromyces sp. GXQ0307 TaxID=3377835 RepID=UPI00383A1A05